MTDRTRNEYTDYTVVKNDFPNGWPDESAMDLLMRLLSENGFSIKEKNEVSADEMVLDARPHTDVYTIEKDGRKFSFELSATTNLRNGQEQLDGIGWFKPSKSIKFEIPPDMDVDAECAAVEYWIRDLTNFFYGKPLEVRKFNYSYWKTVRHEEFIKLKAESEARYQDYLAHPEKYFGPPPRLVEPQMYPNSIVGVIPMSEPVGLAFALRYLTGESKS